MDEKPNRYTLTDGQFAMFQFRFEKLCKTARKLGVEEPTFVVVDEGMRKKVPAGGALRADFLQVNSGLLPLEHFQKIEIAGAAPQVPGFEFVGKVEPSPVDGVNYVKGIPGRDDDLEKFRGIAMECEHCQLQRYRKHVFVVRDTATGSSHVVGKTCLKDFTGHSNPEAIAAFSYALSELGDCEDLDGWTSGGRWTPSFSTLSFVTMAVALTEEHGYRRGGGTRDLTVSALTGDFPFNGAKGSIPAPTITTKHEEVAVASLAWARSLATDSHANSNPYLLNLRLAVSGTLLGPKEFGLAASVAQAHARHLERAVKREAVEVEKDEAAPLPKFDGRVEITGKIISAKWKETDFGDTLKIVVKHADGWAVWGTCPNSLGRTEKDLIGENVSFVARVKASDQDEKFGFFSRPTKARLNQGPATS